MKTWHYLVGAAALGGVGYWLWKKYNPLGDPKEVVVSVERVLTDVTPPFPWKVTKQSGQYAVIALPNNDFVMPTPATTKDFFANIKDQPEGNKMLIGKWSADPSTSPQVMTLKTKGV